MMKQKIIILIAAILVMTAYLTEESAYSQTVAEDLVTAQNQLIAGRSYVINFPEGVTRKELRERYLGDTSGYSSYTEKYLNLKNAIDIALDIRVNRTGEATFQQLETAQLIAWEALEAMIQGQLTAGNANLLNGLRVAFPNATGPDKPAGEENVPVGCPVNDYGNEYNGAYVKDLAYARLHFLRGIVSALDYMANDLDGEIRTTDMTQQGDQFPQYTVFNTTKLPDSNFDGQGEQDIQTIAYLLGNILDRYGKANIGMGDRLWRAAYFDRERGPGGSRSAERQQMLDKAMIELQQSIHSQFMASIPMAAILSDDYCGTVNEYQLCRLDQLRVSAATASDFIDRIRRGEIPKLDSMALNSSTADITNLMNYITIIKNLAATKYNTAEQAIWKTRDSETAMINDAQSLKFQYSNQLYYATYIDPDYPPFNGLVNEAQRQMYRDEVKEKVELMLEEGIGSVLLTEGSEIGQVVLQLLKAKADTESIKSRLDSIPQQIRIEEDRVGAVNGITLGTTNQITAYQLGMGIANLYSVNTSMGFSCSYPSGCGASFSVSKTFNPGAILSAVFQSQITRAQAIERVDINNANAAAAIRNLLLQQHQYSLDYEAAIIQMQLTSANVNATINRIYRLIEDHIYYQDSNAEKWYYDPALIFEREYAELDYDTALNEYKRELYNLSQKLAVRWGEPYENPFLKLDGVPQTLGGGLYDPFTQIESLFNIYKASEGDNYLAALQAWDLVLRSHRTGGQSNVTNIISLRKDILGYSELVWNESLSRYEVDSTQIEPMVRRFKAYLLQRLLPEDSPFWLRLEFPITYNQRSKSYAGEQIPNVITNFRTDWNVRITEVSARIIGNNVAQTPTNTYRIQLYQYGKLEIPKYHPRQTSVYPNFQTFQLPLYYVDPEDASTSPFIFDLQAGINGFDGQPNTEIAVVEPTPFCDNYILLIPRDGQQNLNVQNIEDIEITIKWRSGKPPNFF